VGHLGQSDGATLVASANSRLLGTAAGKLSRNESGPNSPYLATFLATHWVRTLLISAYSAILLVWAMQILA
jgi:hypothetical protein